MSAPADNYRNRIDLKRYAVIPVWYGCNSSCTICMLSNVRGRLGTVDFADFSMLVTRLVNERRYDGLILSGAEVTTFGQLEQYVRHAASFGWFSKIQIQTNGRLLADEAYVKRLVDSGVNEFFVSVHGREDIHDAITRSPGSYAAVMAGIANLAQFPVKVISNTVLTTSNFSDLAALFAQLGASPVHEMQLWNFFPMERTDRRDLVVSMSDLKARLPDMASAIAPSGKALVLKGFPECLFPEPPVFVNSDFPLNLIQDDFWFEFGKNGFGACVHRERCRSRECWGLSSAYIEKYGDERNLLSPKVGSGGAGS